MKIYIPNQSKQSIGGGWSWIGNISKYFHQNAETELVDNHAKADIILIPSASMITKELFNAMKESGKPIVLRIDNALKNSRNRGAGMSRLLKYANGADKLIFQSAWAMKYIKPWLRASRVDKKKLDDSVIIYNGTDTEIFYPPHQNTKAKFDYRYLFVKDKRFDEAAYHFHKKSLKDFECKLTIVGRFDSKLIEHNFDFFNGEKVTYLGQITDRNSMATLMRNHDVLLFPAFADASPQTVVEALNCGMKIELVNDIGGTKELLQLPIEALGLDYMGKKYFEELKELV